MQQVTQQHRTLFNTGTPTGLKAKVNALKLKNTIKMALTAAEGSYPCQTRCSVARDTQILSQIMKSKT